MIYLPTDDVDYFVGDMFVQNPAPRSISDWKSQDGIDTLDIFMPFYSICPYIYTYIYIFPVDNLYIYFHIDMISLYYVTFPNFQLISVCFLVIPCEVHRSQEEIEAPMAPGLGAADWLVLGVCILK